MVSVVCRRSLALAVLVFAVATYAAAWWAVATVGPPEPLRIMACQRQPVACMSMKE